jgi:hypothetical protein
MPDTNFTGDRTAIQVYSGIDGIALKQVSALFRSFRDGSSAPIRRTWFLGCHDVCIGVVLRRQFSSEEPHNSVQCFAEEIHEDPAFCATCYHLAK